MEEIRKLFKVVGKKKYYVNKFGRLMKITERKDLTCIKFIYGSSTPKGYKKYHIGGRNYLAHRLVGSCFLGLDIYNTDILVCHKDDNPGNNYVDNLFLGSAKDNQIDASKKNRMKTKLSVYDIIEIKHLFKKRIPQIDIATRYGVSRTTIRVLKKNTLRGTALNL